MSEIPCVILAGGRSARMGADKCFLDFKAKSLIEWQFEKMSKLFASVFISCKADKFGGKFGEKTLIFDENLEFLNQNSKNTLNSNLNSQSANLIANLNANSSVNSSVNLNSQGVNSSINSALNQISRQNSSANSMSSQISRENSALNANLAKPKREKMADFSSMLALYSVLKAFENKFVFIIGVDTPFVSEKSIQRLILSANEALMIVPSVANRAHFLCAFYHSQIAPLCLKCLQNGVHKISALSQNLPPNALKFVEFSDENEFFNLNTPQDYERIKNA
mgnify:CR=1 FL=1